MSDQPHNEAPVVAPTGEVPVEAVTFTDQFLSYFPGEVAAFIPEHVDALTDSGVIEEAPDTEPITTTTTALVVSGATVVPVESVTGMNTGMVIAAAGIVAGTTIASFAALDVTISAATTASIANGATVTVTPASRAGGSRKLFRVDQPFGATPTPKNYDPQHRDVDPNRPGNFPTRQHGGSPALTDPPPPPPPEGQP